MGYQCPANDTVALPRQRLRGVCAKEFRDHMEISRRIGLHFPGRRANAGHLLETPFAHREGAPLPADPPVSSIAPPASRRHRGCYLRAPEAPSVRNASSFILST